MLILVRGSRHSNNHSLGTNYINTAICKRMWDAVDESGAIFFASCTILIVRNSVNRSIMKRCLKKNIASTFENRGLPELNCPKSNF